MSPVGSYRQMSVHLDEKTAEALDVLLKLHKGESRNSVVCEAVRQASARAVRAERRQRAIRADSGG